MIILPLLLALNFATTAPTTPSTPTTQMTRTVDRAIDVPKHNELHLTTPADWKQFADAPQPGLVATTHFVDPSGKFEMLVSILPAPSGVDLKSFNSPARLHDIAQAQGTQLLKSAKETALELDEIKGPSAAGYVYTLTDKAPAPGSFEYMTAGVVGVGDLMLSVTMLMHEKNPPARAIALDILRSAAQSTAAPATTQASDHQALSISLPDKDWQVSIDVPSDVKVARDESSPDHTARQIVAIDSSKKLVISLFIEPAATMGDAKLARQVYFDRLKTSPILMRDDKFTDGPAESARADYFVPDVDQHHVNLYFSKEGVWVDVHLSLELPKTDATTQSSAASESLEAIVRSARIEKISAHQ